MRQIKAHGKKLVRQFVQPPWDSDIMEFRYGIWQGISSLYTESGRQLGEENTRPFLFNDHIPAKTILCKYDGSRHGRAINISALKTAMNNYGKATAITRAVINHHSVHASKVSSGGIWDLYIISIASLALIAWSVRQQPAKRTAHTVSDDMASQYQFIAGIYMICRHMIDTNSDYVQRNTPIESVTLYDYADRNEIFTSFNGMVCAGSTKKIMDFLEFCIDGMQEAFAAPDTIGGEAPLAQHIDDVEGWYRYALYAIELDCFVKIARRQYRVANTMPNCEAYEQNINTYAQIASYCLSLLPSDESLPEKGYECGALVRQNRILKALNRAPLKTIKPRFLTEQLRHN